MPVEVYTELNLQPLPPGPPPEAYGAVVGRERVRLQWRADKLGQRVTSRRLGGRPLPDVPARAEAAAVAAAGAGSEPRVARRLLPRAGLCARRRRRRRPRVGIRGRGVDRALKALGRPDDASAAS